MRLLANVATDRRQWTDLPRALLVAVTYDSARALALVVRVGHDVRRRTGR
jgi:hypothetical protein